MSDDIHHLAAAYTLDALDPDEQRVFEAHLETCDTCRAEVAEFRDVAGDLATATSAAPPASMRDRVLAEVSQTRQVRPPVRPAPERTRRGRSAVWLAAAAAFIGIIAGAAVTLTVLDRGSDTEPVLSAPDAATVPLDGENGSVRVVWSSDLGRAVVLGDGLPDPGADRVYELWAIVDGEPVPAGLFTPDDGSVRSTLDLDPAARRPAAWGITNEPAGGSPAPTGDILFFAEV